MWKIPLFDLNYDSREENAVLEVLHSKWLTNGPCTQAFENEFSEYLGEKTNSLAVSSCTAALHLSLLACGLRAGDEVILSGLSFVASLNMVIRVGATPVLADSKSLTDWNVSPEDIQAKTTPRTKAIVIVHFAGYPCDMTNILKIANDNNLFLIEDVAHGIGAEYNERKCGTFGDLACFSFFSNKNLSTGEGGMVVTGNQELFEKIKLLRSHGMTSLTVDRDNKKSISYDVLIPGMNYRFDELRAALGRVQLKKLDEANRSREQLVDAYRSRLLDLNGVVVPWNYFMEDRRSSFHIFPVLLPKEMDRILAMEFLREKGIQTSIHYPAYRTFSYYSNVIGEQLKIAEEISKRVLTLPLYPNMTTDDVVYITGAISEILRVRGV